MTVARRKLFVVFHQITIFPDSIFKAGSSFPNNDPLSTPLLMDSFRFILPSLNVPVYAVPSCPLVSSPTTVNQSLSLPHSRTCLCVVCVVCVCVCVCVRERK